MFSFSTGAVKANILGYHWRHLNILKLNDNTKYSNLMVAPVEDDLSERGHGS